MLVQGRDLEGPNPHLILIPNQEEIQLIERVMGKQVDEDGLITRIRGEVRPADVSGLQFLAMDGATEKMSPLVPVLACFALGLCAGVYTTRQLTR